MRGHQCSVLWPYEAFCEKNTPRRGASGCGECPQCRKCWVTVPTADGAGVSFIYLIGYTPAPIDRFGRPRSDIAKVALDAQLRVPYASFPTFASAKRALKKEGFLLVALEQNKKAIDYQSFRVPREGKVALIVGNEVEGLSAGVLSSADEIIDIPMRGGKESLNVTVAAGIALYELSARGK